MKSIRNFVFGFVVALAMMSVTGSTSFAAQGSEKPSKQQADKIIENLKSQAKSRPIEKALGKLLTSGTEEEKISFLTGAKSIDLPKPVRAAYKAGNYTESSLPPCKPHYGCRFRSVCKPPAGKWGWDSEDRCKLVIDNCPDPTCD